MGQEMEINNLTMSKKSLDACSTDKCDLVLFKYINTIIILLLHFIARFLIFNLWNLGLNLELGQHKMGTEVFLY